MSLVDTVTDTLLERIVSGEFSGGRALPPEDLLAEQSGASRLTVREAVKVLASQNVLRPVQGRGTFVNPAERWTSLDAIVRVQRGDATKAIAQLVEVRAMIEVGAAELFASRATDPELRAMAADLESMRTAHAESDVHAFVAADMSFHNGILDGCGNPFVPATFLPISRALQDARYRTSEVAVIREHALVEHGNILDALGTGSAQAAGAAMRSHLIQTRDDAREHLGTPLPTGTSSTG
ncbi:MAG TPA: FadR/GntR family transcriptional regulator [Intrasporangium sp.]|nr:FadR/GntR family transcriptional regulator [Intrasporangium sp.]